MKQIRSESRRIARILGPDIETGGLLLGEVDDASHCVFIDRAEGPTPDSIHRADEFILGLEGAEDTVVAHRKRSGGRTRYVGMWHIHPFGVAAPSDKDKAAMQTLVTPVSNPPPYALVLIAGGVEGGWTTFLEKGFAPDLYAAVTIRPPATLTLPPAGTVAGLRPIRPSSSAVPAASPTQGRRWRNRLRPRRSWRWWR